MKFIQFWSDKLSHPLRGIKHAIKNDFSIRFELITGAIILIALHFSLGPFSNIGQLLLIFCWFLILITETQNSSIETALDRIHPERHNEIGVSKDLAAAAVMWAAIFSIVVLYFVLSGKI